ncbi:hypothetical protein N9124_01545 [bacterium]|nr:hypothetical protein [Akkermansiaceae bacterium]MDB4412638.1 hypothetical protein [bacterium]MDB4272987.1 hypothetical protein [Akkermansiaceae bacterium]MDB4283347.1 hypothetical protein [Akkermansiaceae bacterium]MDB4429676.1 hypothetical protein [Akkermansiaceae bacterium]
MASNPHLPPAPADLTPAHTKRHRGECGASFYQACLEFAQSLWLQGKPAQALLQLNKSSFAEGPFPYAALKWFLEHREDDLFIGNPVRHFQHLATRMAGPRAELRTWRAWACFYLAKATLPEEEFPPDLEQIAFETLSIPPLAQVLEKLPDEEKKLAQELCGDH